MRIAITGAAGFIGSTTAALLLDAGHDVVGIDSLTSYYGTDTKKHNIAGLLTQPAFSFFTHDIATDLFDEALNGAEAIIHLAGQPGVRRSWAEFDSYVHANIQGTKSVLDAAVRHQIERVVYASSSSVYGNATVYPTSEDHPTAPQSPYAVTKLAGEQLCMLYASERELHTVSLRYFTVYGPRQRPDMLTQRLIQAAHIGSTITIFGDGEQVRDFTFVDDVARANVRALEADCAAGSKFNISGGSSVTVNQMISEVERATDSTIRREAHGEATGDVHRTTGDNQRAARDLRWTPSVDLSSGVNAHVDWYRSTRMPVPLRGARNSRPQPCGLEPS